MTVERTAGRMAAETPPPHPLILNLLKDGPPLLRAILRFPPPFPSFNKFRMSGKGWVIRVINH